MRTICKELFINAGRVWPAYSKTVDKFAQVCDSGDVLTLERAVSMLREDKRNDAVKTLQEFRLEYAKYFISPNAELGAHIERVYGKDLNVYLNALRSNPMSLIDEHSASFISKPDAKVKNFDGVKFYTTNLSTCSDVRAGSTHRAGS